MEKKTIGKFIAILRKQKGMTQKELGEKLFVSDKTISRWERDECTPELSLIPAIAEIFGITTDELLRGELNQEKIEEDNEQSVRQVKLMLYNSSRKFFNQSIISITITIIGIIAALICNSCFNKGLLGFSLACIIFIVSITCQICFLSNNKHLIDEYEYVEELKKANTEKTMKTVKIIVFNVLAWLGCLPLVFIPNAYYGLAINSWLVLSLIFVTLGGILIYIIYEMLIIKILTSKKLIYLSEEEGEFNQKKIKILKKVLRVFIIVFVILFVGVIVNTIIDESQILLKWEYVPSDKFYKNTSLYYIYKISDFGTITAVTYDTYYDVAFVINIIYVILVILMFINLLGSFIWYLLEVKKQKKNLIQ